MRDWFVHAKWEKHESRKRRKVSKGNSGIGKVTCGSGNDGAVALRESRSRLRESDDFSRTDKSEVQWVEEQNDVLALVVTIIIIILTWGTVEKIHNLKK